MKKLLLTLLISLNLAMPAHAVVGAPVAAAGGVVAAVAGGTMLGLALHLGANVAYDSVRGPDMSAGSSLSSGGRFLAILFLLDGEKNSENNLVSVNALNDIEALISAKIYTETEGDDLKSEWSAFQSDLSESEKEFFINSEQIQGMSPEEVVATIQSQVGDRKLLAGYLASKMGIQVQ